MKKQEKPERLVIYAPPSVIASLEAARRKTAFPSMSSYALSLLLEAMPKK